MTDLPPAGDPAWADRAVTALSAFRGLSRLQVAVLLRSWRHVDRLTPAQRAEVVDRVAPCRRAAR